VVCLLEEAEYPLWPLDDAVLVGGEIAGQVSFSSIEKHNRGATIGYRLAKSQTCRGLMTAAVIALIADGFQHLK
jgi:RimJ/RimL family protein N-acetyltransferase